MTFYGDNQFKAIVDDLDISSDLKCEIHYCCLFGNLHKTIAAGTIHALFPPQDYNTVKPVQCCNEFRDPSQKS